MGALTEEMALGVARQRSIAVTCVDERSWLRCRSCTTAPATAGVAIDVPEYVAIARLDSAVAEITSEPGARMSTHDPLLEYNARASEDVVAPTVIASGALDGEDEHAFDRSFPAATTTTMPAACAAAIAAFWAELYPPPSEREATAVEAPRATVSLTAHSSAAITSLVYPVPEQSRALTATIVAPLATPYVAPAAVPAQCVPCDEQVLPKDVDI